MKTKTRKKVCFKNIKKFKYGLIVHNRKTYKNA